MASCPQPNLISHGYYIGVKSTYSNDDRVHFVCNSDYTLSGNPTLTCNATSGTWFGDYPSCELSLLSNVWLWTVIGLLTAIVLTLALIILCYCLCCNRGRIFDEESTSHNRSSICECCCRRQVAYEESETSKRKINSKPVVKKSQSEKQDGRAKRKPSAKKTKFTKRKVISKKKGVKNHKPMQSFKAKNQNPEGEETSINWRRDAKEVVLWKPFANPVRNINTSTK